MKISVLAEREAEGPSRLLVRSMFPFPDDSVSLVHTFVLRRDEMGKQGLEKRRGTYFVRLG